MESIKKNLRGLLIFWGIVFGFSWSLQERSLGEESREGYLLTASLTTEEEQFIRQKARRKAYPGGIDEEPLEVQTQLVPEEMMRSLIPSEEGKDNADD